MKKINFLSGKARSDKPHFVSSIFLLVIFVSSPLSGLFNPGKVLNESERRYHDNPQGYYTFFELLPDKNCLEDTTGGNINTFKVRELSMDTTPADTIIKRHINMIIW